MDNLQEAYLSVYQELDEVRGGGRIDPVSNLPGHGERGSRSPKDAGMNMSPLDRAKARENALRKRGDTEATRRANRIKSRFVSPTERGVHRSINASNVAKTAERQRLRNQENQNEQFDLFDYLLEYLVAEGYADTNDNAIAIMANMSEEWKQSILDEEKKEFPSDKVNTKAAQHEKNYLKRPNSYTGQQSKSRSNKMRAIASTVEVGDDPRSTMHGQDLRKIR